ncbi:helix-turn-helix domain-containing protein [Oceanobacillus neutriphilus]|uniref:Transcriptional regulator n=1 Tax=Oceanobacillus neutriphilus TaxID=531815 RepID=A0ABQ2NSJ7_9BACI|nr:helix-turn-helix domain-containing protein [Oceanobacillus neutriphilus]GGP09620.1 transcriptional regulator [Oceanobacillus neutriphilus]
MNHRIGDYIKEKLEEKQITMRALSKKTNINISTVSRIINHKRKPTNQHLMEISKVLDIPFEELLQKNGLPVKTTEKRINDEQDYTAMVKHFLKQSGDQCDSFSMKKIEEKLYEYEQDAETEEGQRLIIENFQEKKESAGNQGAYMQQLTSFFHRFCHKKGTRKELILMGAALIYFISTADVVPDYLFPVGYLDDAIAVQVVMNLLSNKY